ncbi:helix-turn-helix domain-containing protein [Pelosinus propionicus]|uniref:HTH cro/C1-type domain-containing protein n=1 Tax=Pelosinus propionicus DSM 13327 TaxID=1123291 RepID=A0A1I4Q3S0_9FIRM|nr:helix-turn-helix transcriptional regulator [Pelosinus propionicus]SFM34719.1 hypothetical protein SAMN04490355_108216 [Pelosinus propionicus DSM 13327]
MQKNYGDEYVNLGKRIAYYRKKRRISQEEFSKGLDCSIQEVKAIENDYSVSKDLATGIWSVKDLDFLFAIADVLEVDVPVFFLPISDETFEKYRTDK